MKRLLPMSLLVLVCFPGCARRDRPNSNCEWPHETAISLDLNKPADQRHLSEDALLAEDLAIRYADSHKGPRSGHFAGLAEYRRTRDQCMVALFEVIGNTHGVTQEQVRQALVYRRTSLDLAVILSFAVLYSFAASGVARRIWRRFPPEEEWMVGALASLLTSAVVSTVGVLLGEVWSLAAETFRIGSSHLSYRVNRIPWTQHRLSLFVGGVVLFWLVAALHYRAGVRGAKHPGASNILALGPTPHGSDDIDSL